MSYLKVDEVIGDLIIKLNEELSIVSNIFKVIKASIKELPKTKEGSTGLV